MEAAAIGEDRAVPGHERMQAAGGDDRFEARPQPEVVRVRKDDLRAEFVQIARRECLDRRRGTDGHEGRRFDDAVREPQRSAARVRRCSRAA